MLTHNPCFSCLAASGGGSPDGGATERDRISVEIPSPMDGTECQAYCYCEIARRAACIESVNQNNAACTESGKPK